MDGSGFEYKEQMVDCVLIQTACAVADLIHCHVVTVRLALHKAVGQEGHFEDSVGD